MKSAPVHPRANALDVVARYDGPVVVCVGERGGGRENREQRTENREQKSTVNQTFDVYQRYEPFTTTEPTYTAQGDVIRQVRVSFQDICFSNTRLFRWNRCVEIDQLIVRVNAHRYFGWACGRQIHFGNHFTCNAVNTKNNK